MKAKKQPTRAPAEEPAAVVPETAIRTEIREGLHGLRSTLTLFIDSPERRKQFAERIDELSRFVASVYSDEKRIDGVLQYVKRPDKANPPSFLRGFYLGIARARMDAINSEIDALITSIEHGRYSAELTRQQERAIDEHDRELIEAGDTRKHGRAGRILKLAKERKTPLPITDRQVKAYLVRRDLPRRVK